MVRETMERQGWQEPLDGEVVVAGLIRLRLRLGTWTWYQTLHLGHPRHWVLIMYEYYAARTINLSLSHPV